MGEVIGFSAEGLHGKEKCDHGDRRYGSVSSYGRDIGHWEYDMKRSTKIVWCIMVKSHN